MKQGFCGFIETSQAIRVFDASMPTAESIISLARTLKAMLVEPTQSMFLLSPVVYRLLCRAYKRKTIRTLLGMRVLISLDVRHIAVRKQT